MPEMYGMMLRTFKYRAYPKGDAEAKALEWLRLCRWLYNACLEQRIDAYRRCGRSLSSYDQQLELKDLKLDENFPEYKSVGSQVLKDVVRRLDKAYKAFFRRVRQGLEAPGFPKFKNIRSFNSFTFPNASGWRYDGKLFHIVNVGSFRLHGGKPIQGDIKTVTVKRMPTGKWFVLFACDNVPKNVLAPTGRRIALDVGLVTYLTDNISMKTSRPYFFRDAERKLRILDRKLARQQPGSRRREQTRVERALLYEQIVNRRTNFACKLALAYARSYDVIAIEDLNIRKMMVDQAFPGAAKWISDAQWNELAHRLENKCEEFGRELILVDPAYTTRTCNECGYVHEHPVKGRTFECPQCGHSMFRPLNSAKNISEKAGGTTGA